MAEQLQYDFTFDRPRQNPLAHQTNGVMCILLMGDFSGRSNRGLDESGDKLPRRSITAVDFDNFKETMCQLAPQLRLPIGETAESSMEIQFTQLEDFHPDELYQQAGLFQALREFRARLLDPADPA